MDIPKKTEQIVPKYKWHWHVLMIHFPISLFVVAFIFQVLHLFMAEGCFELATNVSLIMGTVVMIPTVATGWITWKGSYKGAKGSLFQRKIYIGFAMLALSVILATWRISLGMFEEQHESPVHWIYLAGNTLLIIGALAEGYFGGRLNHR